MPIDPKEAAADIKRVLGRKATARHGSGYSLERATLFRACLERWAPPGSVYARTAATVPLTHDLLTDTGFRDAERELREILSALLKDYQAGRLLTFQQLVHAALFDDLLGQAEHLLRETYLLPAAVVAGAALEEHPRQLAPLHSVSVSVTDRKGRTTPRMASGLNDDLHLAKAYSQPEWRQVQVWLDLRNEAAHGKTEFQKRTGADIRPMVDGIRAFIVKYPA